MHQHQSTQITLYIYIKVLLVFSGYIGGDAGVAACVRHLSVSDLDNPPLGCDRHVFIGVQNLKKVQLFRQLTEQQTTACFHLKKRL